MVTITVQVDESTYESVKSVAEVKGTSVDSLVVEYLESIGDTVSNQQAAGRRILELSDAAKSGSGPEGRTWTREDIYDRWDHKD